MSKLVLVADELEDQSSQEHPLGRRRNVRASGRVVESEARGRIRYSDPEEWHDFR